MTVDLPGYNSFTIPVPEEFKEVFSHFYYAQNKTPEVVRKTLLPSYQTILLFSFGAKGEIISKNIKIEVDKCLIIGPIKQAFDYTLPVGSEILVANFKGDAFYRFFGSVILLGLPVNPDELVDENCFTNLWHELKNMNEVGERVHIILEFCKPYLRKRNTISAHLTNFKDETRSAIRSIAKEVCQSERNVQLSHKKYLGYSAKEINRY